MKILITGNMGYVGSVLTRHLRSAIPDAFIVGYDKGLFAHCLTTLGELPERCLDIQHFGDVRSISANDLIGFDTVIHLAAISNDPMGDRFEAITDSINHRASVALAEAAATVGVSNFVFASSCSVYGFAEGGRPRKEGDPLNPLTAYARSKIATEEALKKIALNGMTVTALRFATACGMSDRLRLDLVLNDFVACAMTSGRISVLSDGSPWRPLIDVRDMARAIEWASTRDADKGGRFLVVNAGSNDWNFQVQDLAIGVANNLLGTTVTVNTVAPPDKRSYRVDFSLFKELAPDYQPLKSLDASITRMVVGLGAIHFRDHNFRQSNLIRLRSLESFVDGGLLNDDLQWI